MAILVKKGDPNPTPTFGSIGTLGTAGINTPVTSTVIPSGATPTVPSGGVAPSSPTSITQPASTSTFQKPTISPPSTSSPITSTLIGAGAGAIAGNLLNDKTGKTLTDFLGITKPITKPVGGGAKQNPSGGTSGGLPLKLDTTLPQIGITKPATKPVVSSAPYKDTSGTTVSEDLGGGYYQDGNGNTYDGSGNLVLSNQGENGYIYFGDPNNPVYFDKDYNEISSPYTDVPYTETPDTTVADSGYMMDDQGNIYDSEGNFISYADGTVYDTTRDTLASEDTQPIEEEVQIGKEGGLITMMRNGGNVQHFYSGGRPSQSELDYQNSAQTADYRDRSQDMVNAGYSDNGDGTYSTMQQDGSIVTLDNMGTPINSPLTKGYNKFGTPVDFPIDLSARVMPLDENFSDYENIDRSKDMLAAGYSDNGNGTYSTPLLDGTHRVATYNNMGMPVDSPSPIATPYQDTSGTAVSMPYNDTSGTTVSMPSVGGTNTTSPDTPGGLSGITDMLKNGGVQGALVGALLAQLMNSSGSSGGQNQGVDMSKVGALTPRTTNFGIGPTNVVTADQYRNPVGTGTDIYGGTDLYHNLNAPGFNPVNPEPTPAAPTANPTAPPMANGGLASSGQTHYTFGKQVSPMDNMGLAPQAMKTGGLPRPSGVPMVDGRNDYRMGAAVSGAGTGQSDDIPAMLADGEYVLDSDLVSMLGDGSNKAGSQILDKWREEIRRHKRSAPVNKIPPPAKSPLAYMKGIK